jgi:hypothetical protein
MSARTTRAMSALVGAGVASTLRPTTGFIEKSSVLIARADVTSMSFLPGKAEPCNLSRSYSAAPTTSLSSSMIINASSARWTRFQAAM